MKFLLTCIALLFITFGNAQIETSLQSTKSLNADRFVGIDQFNNTYSIKNNSFFKNEEKTYTNFSLGTITSADISNPYKIVLFYADFNTVILLDNQLNETDKITFDYNVLFARKSGANNLWIFNRDEALVEVYNYKSNTIENKTSPLLNIHFSAMRSNLNEVFMQSDSLINTYDYLGNQVASTPIKTMDDFEIDNKRIIYLKNKQLYLHDKSRIEKIKISISNMVNFQFTNNDLYIFDGQKVNHFILNKND
ncbi:hypothetical protein [Flavicella sediminum]|uniref:hypothetical protein n=1 Tax=Flavicella sediminum TaxID=2585141 RepID=UPI00111E70BD|nr:hypothetical protein [Flavicella sediminum]